MAADAGAASFRIDNTYNNGHPVVPGVYRFGYSEPEHAGHLCYHAPGPDVCYVAYSNNTEPGTATVTLNGTGNFTGTLSRDFIIEKKDISRAVITMNSGSYTYTGNAQIPSPAVRMEVYTVDPVTNQYMFSYETLVEGVDYEIASCMDNVNAGTATVTIAGKGGYSGTVTKTFNINPVPLASAIIPHTAMVYTGTPRTMTNATVVSALVNGTETVLARGTDYTISYSDNTEIGTAVMTITGRGNYTGTLTKTFKIIPPATTMSSVTSAASGKFIAAWNAQTTQTNGYQIQYSTSSTFDSDNHTASVSGNGTLTKTVSNLPSGTKYYVRVRTYKQVEDTRYYSDWSSAQTVTIQ